MTDQSTYTDTVYLNGAFVPADEACVSPFDRAFLFAHAAYEVTAVFNGRLIDWPGHVARLERTLTGLDIPMPMSADELLAVHEELMARNELKEGLVYLQVTGGSYGTRDFAGPETLTPGLFLFTTSKPLITAVARDGVEAISVADTRWARRDMKTTQLASQALAYRQARREGAEIAWLHEDGMVTEAASANAWIVTQGGELVTRNLSAAILPGITRQSTMRLMAAEGYTITERAFSLAEAHEAAEAFTTSTGAVILPVLSLDGRQIGAGRPGPVPRAVQRHCYSYFGADIAQIAPWLVE